MVDFYPLTRWALRAGLLLAPAGAIWAQAPIITSVIPMANARAAARTSPVTVNFNQPLTAASAGALKVFSSQRGGLRTRATTPAVVSGSALSFAPPNYDFRPGETVQYTVTTAAASSGGTLSLARVGQLTAAAGSSGGGIFGPGSDVTAAANPAGVVLGDLDGDGDLDLVSGNYNNLVPVGTASIRLNNGRGVFSGSQDVAVGGSPIGVALGDIDGDGDLDLLTANYGTVNGNSVSVRLNDGNGVFSGSQSVLVGSAPKAVKLGDVDGDGDLDLLTTNSVTNTVSVRLNNGSGTFSGGRDFSVNTGPHGLALGDVDGDGDLDILTASFGLSTVGSPGNTVCIRLNGGTGPLAATARHSLAAAFVLYPNPTHGAATLTGALPNTTCTVLDALGRVLLTALADATGTAHLAWPEGLPAGVYLVRSGGQVRRLVVE